MAYAIIRTQRQDPYPIGKSHKYSLKYIRDYSELVECCGIIIQRYYKYNTSCKNILIDIYLNSIGSWITTMQTLYNVKTGNLRTKSVKVIRNFYQPHNSKIFTVHYLAPTNQFYYTANKTKHDNSNRIVH